MSIARRKPLIGHRLEELKERHVQSIQEKSDVELKEGTNTYQNNGFVHRGIIRAVRCFDAAEGFENPRRIPT